MKIPLKLPLNREVGGISLFKHFLINPGKSVAFWHYEALPDYIQRPAAAKFAFLGDYRQAAPLGRRTAKHLLELKM